MQSYASSGNERTLLTPCTGLITIHSDSACAGSVVVLCRNGPCRFCEDLCDPTGSSALERFRRFFCARTCVRYLIYCREVLGMCMPLVRDLEIRGCLLPCADINLNLRDTGLEDSAADPLGVVADTQGLQHQSVHATALPGRSILTVDKSTAECMTLQSLR